MDLTSVLDTKFDSDKPSLFELASEAQLSSLLSPSIRYLLTVATHRYPRYLLRILNSFDELYALVMLVVEHHYIVHYGGGITENFYGLKREKVPLVGEIRRASLAAPSHVSKALKLKKSDIWKNLAIMVGIPYIKRKLDESYEINTSRSLLGTNYTRLPLNPTLKQRLLHCYRWFLQNIYPSINAAYYFSIFAFNLAYLYDNTKYNTPFLWLIKTRIRRLSESDYQATAKSEEMNRASSSVFSSNRMLAGLKTLLPTSIFALRFLEWWYASDFSRQFSRKASEGIELPPPINTGATKLPINPNPSNQDTNSVNYEETSEAKPLISEETPIASTTLLPIFTVTPVQNPEFCPICQQEIITATACQTGFVFCYTCIHRWLEGCHFKQEEFMKGKQGKWDSGKGRCAVTGRRVLGGTDGLRKLMV